MEHSSYISMIYTKDSSSTTVNMVALISSQLKELMANSLPYNKELVGNSLLNNRGEQLDGLSQRLMGGTPTEPGGLQTSSWSAWSTSASPTTHPSSSSWNKASSRSGELHNLSSSSSYTLFWRELVLLDLQGHACTSSHSIRVAQCLSYRNCKTENINVWN